MLGYGAFTLPYATIHTNADRCVPISAHFSWGFFLSYLRFAGFSVYLFLSRKPQITRISTDPQQCLAQYHFCSVFYAHTQTHSIFPISSILFDEKTYFSEVFGKPFFQVGNIFLIAIKNRTRENNEEKLTAKSKRATMKKKSSILCICSRLSTSV